MRFAILAFLAVFLLIASGGLLLFYREVMLKRISEVINPRRKQKSADSSGAADRVFDRQRGGAVREPDAEEREGSFGRQAAADARGLSQRVGGEDFLRLQSAAAAFAGAGRAGDGTGAPGPVFCVPDGAGRGISGAGLLAGQEDREAAKEDQRGVCPTCWICW